MATALIALLYHVRHSQNGMLRDVDLTLIFRDLCLADDHKNSVYDHLQKIIVTKSDTKFEN